MSNARRTAITLVNYWSYQYAPDRWRTGHETKTDSNPDRSQTGENPITTGFFGGHEQESGPLTDRFQTADRTQTINPNNGTNCTVPVSSPDNEKIAPTSPPEQREIFRYIQKLNPGKNGADELQYLINQGVTDQLIRWAVDKAAEKGKLWSYARGILMNCLNSGQKNIPTPKPVKPSKVGWGGNGWEPSYDLDELERRGLMVPEFKED